MPSAGVPAGVLQAVLPKSSTLSSPTVCGYDFNRGVHFPEVLETYVRSGFQAQNFGLAVEEITRMMEWSLAQEPVAHDEDAEFRSADARAKVRTKIFLAFTSNLISSGLRETLRFLVQHSMVQVVCSSAGGIEEDLIKCLAPTHVGEFSLDGVTLRKKGINRIGNLLVPNNNYCLFEDWLAPLLEQMHREQNDEGTVWTPSRMIHRFGEEINNEESVCYWAYKNNIPVFCPAITDGSIGDMVYFHSHKLEGFIIDIAADIRAINDEAVRARRTGCIVLGGGVVKHHTMNANLMRNGTDHCVYISTAHEFDGCDSGARPDEAKSWGKIRVDATPVKLFADATLVFPLIVGLTFAKKFHDGDYAAREGVIFDKSYTESEHEIERAKTENSAALMQ